MNNGKTELQRVNINLPVSIVNQVKEYASELGVNTTSAYIFLLNQALNQRDAMKLLPLIIEQAKQLNLNEPNED